MFSVMLNDQCTINMSCAIINLDSVTTSVRLFYTELFLILAVIPLYTIKRSCAIIWYPGVIRSFKTNRLLNLMSYT